MAQQQSVLSPAPAAVAKLAVKRRFPRVLFWVAGALALVAAAVAVRIFLHRPEGARLPITLSAVNGVTDREILFGMSAPLSGSAREVGRGMQTGIELAFEAANEAGGVHGRRLRLIALDDGYEPTRTREPMRQLLDSRKVLAMVGNVRSPAAA